jgi:murein DD-endopeptidase MepM/ murein hydrolase activator NlpD
MSLVVLTPPTESGLVSSGWGAPRDHRDGTHEGLDFPGDVGSPVLAAADGVVVQAKNVDNSLAGMFVAIEHAGGVITRYLHNLRNLVSVGDRVRRGQPIALLGQTGTSGTGRPHVHFDVKLTLEAFAKYVEKFGTPTPGYRGVVGLGVGVPAEALVAGAKYRPGAIEDALKSGVKFHSSKGPIVGLMVAGIGIGYLVRRFGSSR